MLNIFQGRLILVRMILLAAMLGLVAIGIYSIYACGNPAGQEDAVRLSVSSGAWQRQVVFALAGLLSIVIINFVDYRRLGPWSYWIYAVVLILLAVLIVGTKVSLPFVPMINGTYRWIQLHEKLPRIQPSEFCKIAYILALAWYLRFRSNYRKLTGLIGPFALTLLAMVLILLEPDLGTVLLMMPILFAMLFIAGAKVKHLLIIILLAILVSPVLWHHMSLNQRQRISSVLLQNPWVQEKVANNTTVAQILTGKKHFDITGWERKAGWQLKHSKLAIASGGLRGYGYRQGPYIVYNSLPERHNDFIFAIIAHQWGLLGCAIVIALYAVIIACGNEIAWHNTDPFARLISIGIIAMFAVQVIVNVSMTVGLMPITGLTLPLVSYGGSSLLVSMMAIGLLINIGKSRPFSVAGKAFESNNF